jgi:hypothetical protein
VELADLEAKLCAAQELERSWREEYTEIAGACVHGTGGVSELPSNFAFL